MPRSIVRGRAPLAATIVAASCLALVVGCAKPAVEADQSAAADKSAAPASSPTATPSEAPPVEISANVAAGEQSLREGNYAAAIEQFTQALREVQGDSQQTNPGAEEAKVYYERGLAYLKMGFPDTAAKDFTAAINLLPLDGAPYQQRAVAYLEMGDLYKSLRDATEAIRLQPENAASYRTRGVVYLRRGKYDRAVADMEQALHQNPALAGEVVAPLGEAYYRWSQTLSDEGEDAVAAEKLAKALELNPDFVERQSLVVVEERAPAAVVQTVAKPIVDDATEHFRHGRELQVAEQYDQALIEFTQAIALRRDYHEAYHRRGETLLAMGFPDTALEDFKSAANRGGKSGEVYLLQAKCYMELKGPFRAAMAATDALHFDPTAAPTYALRGEAYLMMENWERAVADLDEAIRRDPSLAEPLEAQLTAAREGLAKAQEARLQATTP